MNVMPKKYLSYRNQSDAIHLMRKWIAESGVQVVFDFLIEAYKVAESQDKHYIGCLIAMTFDMRLPKHAYECAAKLGIQLDKDFSVGESLLANLMKEDLDKGWRKIFSDKVVYTPIYTEDDFDSFEHPLIFSNSCSRKIAALSYRDQIHVIRESDGAIGIVIIDKIKDSVLIDEESFQGAKGEEYPLYFTESTHYVSPVFRLRVIGKLLEFFLREIGYPTVKIRYTVVFNSPEASLINISDYFPGGEFAEQWADIRVCLRKDYRDNYVFHDILSCIGGEGSIGLKVSTGLLNCLAAVKILYHELCYSERMLEACKSDASIRKLCKEFSIFSEAE